MILHYDIPELVPYINWPYFFFAWQLKQQAEQERMRGEAEAFLDTLAGRYKVHALFSIVDAHADGDDIIIQPKAGSSAVRIPFLRQQKGSPCLCLADFVHPIHDRIGLFATSADTGLETDFDHDLYEQLMARLLADRLAEAAAERMHEAVRKHYWGYAKDEQLSIADLHLERFRGIRPAVGYPSLPDTGLNFVIDNIINLKQIGIRLTENGAMRPHASISGLMLAHPESRYFNIGKIGEDQLRDYAYRRGLPVTTIRKFLATNL